MKRNKKYITYVTRECIEVYRDCLREQGPGADGREGDTLMCLKFVRIQTNLREIINVTVSNFHVDQTRPQQIKGQIGYNECMFEMALGICGCCRTRWKWNMKEIPSIARIITGHVR